MKRVMIFITSKIFRNWLYGFLIALLPILTAYGLITEEVVPHIIGLITATLGFGLAKVNTKEEVLKEKIQDGIGWFECL